LVDAYLKVKRTQKATETHANIKSIIPQFLSGLLLPDRFVLLFLFSF